MKKKALITGITGMDGSHLSELLLEKGYEVHGIIRRSSSFNTGRIDHIYPQLKLHYGDVTDTLSIEHVIQDIKPDELYNLAAQSHVAVSFELPEYTGQVDALGVLRILETVRRYSPHTKIYQASTSELFGKVEEVPQKETTPFHPRSPYGVAKLYAYWICKNYRESYNLFISNGILFNHEGERRGETFVTRKITKGLVNWTKTKTPIHLGNLNTKRDWGYAKDFVYGMYLILQQDKPDDFVLATGEAHSNKEFVEEACKYVNIDIVWRGEGVNEIGVDRNTNNTIVIQVDPKYFRPAEVDLLLGDPTKAKEILDWEAKTKFKDLVKLMMESDLDKYGEKNLWQKFLPKMKNPTENDFYVRIEKEPNKIIINSVNLNDAGGSGHLNKIIKIDFILNDKVCYSLSDNFSDPNINHWVVLHEYSNDNDDLKLNFYEDSLFLFDIKIEKLYGNHIYNKIDGWFDFQSVYKQAVQNGKDGDHFIEIGSWLGRSGSFMATEIKNSGKKIKFDCVDTWQGSGEVYHESYIKEHGSVYDNFLKNISPLKEYINPIVECSYIAPKYYEDLSLDFVFIDADHSYEIVKKDITEWYPKVKIGGTIAGHDYYNSEHVQKAVNEIFGENITQNRLSWIHKKKSISSPMSS